MMKYMRKNSLVSDQKSLFLLLQALLESLKHLSVSLFSQLFFGLQSVLKLHISISQLKWNRSLKFQYGKKLYGAQDIKERPSLNFFI